MRWSDGSEIYVCSACVRLVDHAELVEHQDGDCSSGRGHRIGVWKACPSCNGSGEIRTSTITVGCRACDGKGGSIHLADGA